MRHIFLCVLCAFAVMTFACSHIRPVITTETKAGEIITQAEIQRTADKNDMPDVDGKLLAIVETKTNTGETAKTYIVQEKFNPLHPFKQRTKAYQNEAAKKNAPATGGAVLPKFPWYHWPLIWLKWLALIICVAALIYLKGWLSMIIGPIKSLFKLGGKT